MFTAVFAIGSALVGKLGLSWVLGIFGGGLLAPLTAALTAAVEIAAKLANWLLETVLAGLAHLIKSVPAMITVMLVCWGAYGYGKLTANVPASAATTRPAIVKSAPSLSLGRYDDDDYDDGDWTKKVFGN